MNIGGPVISQAIHRCRFKKTHSREEEVWRGSIPCNGIIVSILLRVDKNFIKEVEQCRSPYML